MLQEIPYRPSVLKDDPAYAARGYATDSDKIRWVRGWPQSRKGSEQVGDDTLDGVARGGHVYSTANGTQWAVLGTHTRAYALRGSRAWNITPIRSSATLGTDPFTTTAGGGSGQTVSVTVNHTAHGAGEGDTVLIRGSATFDNLTPGGANGTLSSSPFRTISGSRLVVVTHTSHGLTTGDMARFSSASAVGGITIGATVSGTYASGPFATTADSVMVVVTLTSHGLYDGEIVTIAGGSAVGGITIAGDYVAKIVDDNTYVIAHTSAATSSTTGGGTPTYSTERAYGIHTLNADRYLIEHVTEATSSAEGGGTPGYEYSKMHKITGITDADNYTIDVVGTGAQSGTTGGGSAVDVDYEITIGLQDSSGSGYGTGGYGSGPFGTSADPLAYKEARTWAIADRIDFAYLNPVDGTIYEWTANASRRAVALQNAPARVRSIVVSGEYNIMAFGCTNDEGNFRPMLMRHSDGTNVEEWVATPVNNAGSKGPIGGGNAFIVAKVSKNGVIAWTERSMHAFRYTRDQDDLYAEDTIATNCGVIGPNAVAENNGMSFWITPQKSFCMFNGGAPSELPNPCRQWFEDTLAFGQGAKIYASVDKFYHAIDWFFPSSDGTDNDTYVRYDMMEGGGILGWSVGTWNRSLWIDNMVFDKPLSVDSITGAMYFEETGLGDDGGAVTRFIEYAPIDLASGSIMQNVERVVTSTKLSANAAVDVTLKFKQWPNNTEETKGPFTLKNDAYPDGANTDVMDTMTEARQMSLRVESTGSEDFWRMANVRYDRAGGPPR